MCIKKKCEVCLLFSERFDSFNRVFNFSVPEEHFKLFEIIPIQIPVCVTKQKDRDSGKRLRLIPNYIFSLCASLVLTV